MEKNNDEKILISLDDSLPLQTQVQNQTYQESTLFPSSVLESQTEIPLPKARYWMLFLFCMSTMTNGCAWICLAPIFECLKAVYGVSLQQINYLSSSYMIFFAPLNFPSVKALDKYGLRVGLIVGSCGTAIGLWVTCLINKSFIYVLAGQTICALASPFIINAPTKITSNWFAENERSFATMVGACANIFGICVGFFLPYLFVDQFDPNITYSGEELQIFRDQIEFMLISLSIFGTFISLLIVILFQTKPKRPQGFQNASFVGQCQRQYEQDSLKAIKILFANWNYVFAAIAMSLIVIFNFCIQTIIGQLILPFGFIDSHFTSLLGILFDILGIFGSIVACILIAKFQTKDTQLVLTLKRAAILLLISTLVSFSYFFYATIVSDRLQLIFAVSLLGLFCNPIIFIAYELLVGLTPGVGEAMSCGILNSTANFFSFLIILSITPFLGNQMKEDTLYVMIGLAAVIACSLIFTFLVSPELKLNK